MPPPIVFNQVRFLLSKMRRRRPGICQSHDAGAQVEPATGSVWAVFRGRRLVSGFVSLLFQTAFHGEAPALQTTFRRLYPLVDARKKHNNLFFLPPLLKVLGLKGNSLTLSRLLGRTS